MNHGSDKTGSKLLFLVLFVLVIFLAFFDFNIPNAFHYVVSQDKAFFSGN
jgi:hypothetical protein